MHIGLMFHGVVTGVVTIIAFVLVRELVSQRMKPGMRAYALFWTFTGLLWLQNAVRNTAFGVGFDDFPRLASSVLSQMTVYASGVPLFYYAAQKFFASRRIVWLLTAQAAVAGLVGSIFLALPGGITFEPATFFTIEAVANPISAMIFRIEIGAIFLLLLLDIVTRRRRRREGVPNYEVFYDAAVMLYVGFGAIDLAKVVEDWRLVIFRLFYCAAFLTVYLVVRHEREAETEYLTMKMGEG